MNDLSALSDRDLLSNLHASLASERTLVARVLAILMEVEERRLHLLAGHSSMFVFCTTALGMSEGEAFRRITAARMAKTYPAILDLVASGALHLSGLFLLRDLAVLMERAMDALIAELEKTRRAKAKRPRATKGTKPGTISRAARREVFERDGEQCGYVSETGQRCQERRAS